MSRKEELEKEVNEHASLLDEERINNYKQQIIEARKLKRRDKIDTLDKEADEAFKKLDKEADEKLGGLQGFENWGALMSRIFAYGQVLGDPLFKTLELSIREIENYLCDNYPIWERDSGILDKLPKRSLVDFSPTVNGRGELNSQEIFKNAKLSDGSELTPIARLAIIAGMKLWLHDNGYTLAGNGPDPYQIHKTGDSTRLITQAEFNKLRDDSLDNFMNRKYEMRTVPEAEPMHRAPTP